MSNALIRIAFDFREHGIVGPLGQSDSLSPHSSNVKHETSPDPFLGLQRKLVVSQTSLSLPNPSMYGDLHKAVAASAIAAQQTHGSLHSMFALPAHGHVTGHLTNGNCDDLSHILSEYQNV